MQNKLSTKKGFTLIEIVIALAIAALIIVVVLLAVQGAQRSQRNDARKATINRVRAAVTDAKSNNQGNATLDQVIAAMPTSELNVANVGTMGIAEGTYDDSACSGTTQHGNLEVRVVIADDTAAGCLEGGSAYQSR